MSNKRTEEQIVARAAIEITLGDKVFLIKPLNINKAVDWRKMLHDEMTCIVNVFNTSSNNLGQAIGGGLGTALLEFPDKLTKLLFAYSSDLDADREWIMENATEEQVATAFSGLMVVAYPFLTQLATISQAISMVKAK